LTFNSICCIAAKAKLNVATHATGVCVSNVVNQSSLNTLTELTELSHLTSCN